LKAFSYHLSWKILFVSKCIETAKKKFVGDKPFRSGQHRNKMAAAAKLTKAFFDISIGGQKAGRIVFQVTLA
jgi:hypothetical protein